MAVSSKSLYVMLNLFLVYISWGSSYIGYKFTLEVLGPFSAGGARMVIAGLLLMLGLFLTGRWRRLPSRADLVHSLWMSFFMVTMATGFLAKGQTSVASSTAAVITGSVPITMLVAGWLFAGEPRPSRLQWTGLAIGSCGLLLLASSQQAGGVQQSSPEGMLWVFSATLGWVAGTLITRRFPHATRLSTVQSCALMLLVGGLECLALAFLTGEQNLVHWENLSLRVILAFAWMCTGGSIIAFYCYLWLLENTAIATAISYEYVVPVIGVFLGWQLGGEIITPGMLLACGLTVGSVCFIIRRRDVS